MLLFDRMMYFFGIVFENEESLLSQGYFALVINKVLLLISDIVIDEVRHPVMEHIIQVRRRLQIQQILVNIIVFECQFQKSLDDENTLELYPSSIEQHHIYETFSVFQVESGLISIQHIIQVDHIVTTVIVSSLELRES